MPSAVAGKGVNARPRPSHKTNTPCIPITQINLRHKKGAWGTLLSNILIKKHPIILATEPYAETSNLLPKVHKDLVPFYYKKGDQRPRAAILVHKSLADKSWELTQFTTKDQIAIQLKHDKEDIILVSSYMDYTSSQCPPTELIKLVDHAKKQGLPLIVGSDTNSHHTIWGNRSSNKRGEDLLDLMVLKNLKWSNKGSTPTFFNTQGHSSIIDLTICNKAAEDLIDGWHVSSQFSNSDHCYIFFDLVTKTKITSRQIRNVRSTDWEGFHKSLDSNPKLQELNQTALLNIVDLDKAAEDLNSILKEAYESNCPKTYISSSIKKPPWLTAEVQAAQRGVRHQLMKARSTKTEPEWESYRKRVREYEKLKKKVKKTGWREFCKNAESMRDCARMSNILKSSSSKKEKLEALYKPPKPKNPGSDDPEGPAPPDSTSSNTTDPPLARGNQGTPPPTVISDELSTKILTTNPEETLEVLVETHFTKGPTSDLDRSPVPTISTPQSVLNTIYDHTRLSSAVKSFEPEKAAGPDGIQPVIIQRAWGHISAVTRNIMTTSHKLQHVPKPWKESKTIFVAKPGKKDYNQAKSYRPITLTPVFLKLQEKVILWHMQTDLNMTSLTSERQFGFKKGSSTETALHKIVHKIEKWIAQKGYALGTFLDIEGAFDNVSFKAVSSAINKSPVDPSTASWIINMVTDRYVTITHKTASRRIKVRRGCPQGGVLSPFLWNLIVDDLLAFTMDAVPAYLQAFADDLVSLALGRDLDHIRAVAQKTINTIERWCKSKGLNISVLKTKIVLFSWKKSPTLPCPIKVGGKEIELSSSVKFLGVTLDHKLNFNEHIDRLVNKATAALMQCKEAVGPCWGLTPKACLWIYTAVVRPMLSYASVIWVNALNKVHNVKKLEKVQALALRITAGAMSHTNNEALDIVTGTPSIHNYLKGEAAKGASRLQAYKDWTREKPSSKGTIVAHSTINNNYIAELDLPARAEQDLTKPISSLLKRYTIEVIDQANLVTYRKHLGDQINQTSSLSYTCYTDGSKTEQGTGFGYIVTTNNNNTELMTYSAKLPEFCTVYQAELMAIKTAADEMATYTEKDIIFYTDSLSSLQALNSTTLNSRTAIECHNSLNGLAAQNIVTMKWVAGHEGHWGNEKADLLAKQGTISENLTKGYLPQSLIIRKINMKVIHHDSVNWAKQGHSHTKMTLGNKHHKTLDGVKSLLKDRKGYRAAVHLITGHAGLNSHLFKMTLADTNICPLCESDEETVGHFLGQCPALARIRGEHFNCYYASMTDIFENFDILKIVSYAKHTKRLDYEKKDESGVT